MPSTPRGTRDRRPGATILPVAALVGAIISIQYGATLAKALFSTVGAQGTTALRLCMAAIMLGACMRPWRARLSRRMLPALVGYGVTLGAMNLLFYMALATVPLGRAVALQFSGPLLVSVTSSRKLVDFAWIGLAVAGLLLLSPFTDAHQPLDPGGVALALASAACWALYIVCGQRAGRELGTQTVAIGMAIAAVIVLPIGIVHAGAALLEPATLRSAAVVGFVATALPFSLEMAALTRLPARVYGTLTSMEPAIGALMGLLLLHETLTGPQWGGIAAVSAAALGAARSARTPDSRLA